MTATTTLQDVATTATTGEAGNTSMGFTAPLEATNALFSVQMWRKAFESACQSEATAATKICDLVVRAHGMVDLEAAREIILHAFANAVAKASGGSFEAALELKSVKNRTADAMAILKCKELPASLPRSLQAAAAACRAAGPKRPPRAGGKAGADAKPGVTVPKGKLSATELLNVALEALRAECGDNVEALSLVGDLADLAMDLAEALALNVSASVVPDEDAEAA